MCNQAVGLLQGELEKAGITTVSISLLKHITVKVAPPRALFVPFPHGYPLGLPGDAELQRLVLRAALALLERESTERRIFEDLRLPALASANRPGGPTGR